MRDPLGLNERAFARWYPIVCGISERAGQEDTRRRLVSQATGQTLEIGAGSGLNLPHYTDAVTELVVSEPSPHMREHLSERLESDPPPVGGWDLVDAGAESLPLENSSFDTVVATFVLCSVDDPAGVLNELARVLRPGGRYLFLEHVHAGEDTRLGRFQDLIEVPHRYIAAGCHPNRRGEEILDASPFDIERLEHGEQPRAFPSVRPTIRGSARLPERSAPL